MLESIEPLIRDDGVLSQFHRPPSSSRSFSKKFCFKLKFWATKRISTNWDWRACLSTRYHTTESLCLAKIPRKNYLSPLQCSLVVSSVFEISSVALNPRIALRRTEIKPTHYNLWATRRGWQPSIELFRCSPDDSYITKVSRSKIPQ